MDTSAVSRFYDAIRRERDPKVTQEILAELLVPEAYASSSSSTASPSKGNKKRQKISGARRRKIDELEAYVASLPAPALPVCGKVFKEGDMGYNCLTCQTDPTCVLCAECFHDPDHRTTSTTSHFIPLTDSCCDWHLEAWALEGCCSKHRKGTLERRGSRGVAKRFGKRCRRCSRCVRSVPQTSWRKYTTFAAHRDQSDAQEHVRLCCDSNVYHVLCNNDDVHTYQQVTDAFRADL